LGKTPVTVTVDLFGPFASRDDIDCEGTPYWTGKVDVPGDGEFQSPKATIRGWQRAVKVPGMCKKCLRSKHLLH